jgi:hypothetical protein
MPFKVRYEGEKQSNIERANGLRSIKTITALRKNEDLIGWRGYKDMFILGNGRRQVMCDEFTVKDWHVCFTYNYTTYRTLSTYQVLFPLNWVIITS